MALVSKVICELAVQAPGSARRRALVVDFTFDASYPAKGYTLAAATLGLTTIEAVIAGSMYKTDTANSGAVIGWDKEAGKLVLFEAAANGALLDDATQGNVTVDHKVVGLVIGW